MYLCKRKPNFQIEIKVTKLTKTTTENWKQHLVCMSFINSKVKGKSMLNLCANITAENPILLCKMFLFS